MDERQAGVGQLPVGSALHCIEPPGENGLVGCAGSKSY